MPNEPEGPLKEGRLDSWKEIAAYLGVSVRTAHRWERREGLPVRRHQHEKGVSVYALRGELDEWRVTRDERLASAASAATGRKSTWLLAATAALAAGAVILAAWLRASRTDTQGRTRVFELPVVPTQTGWSENDDYSRPVLSPTGDSVAFIRQGRVWLRDLAATEARALEDSVDGERVFWSPDGRWVGFFRQVAAGLGSMWKVPVTGGPATLVCSLPTVLLYGTTWSPDGTIVLATASYLQWAQGRLWSVSAEGGELQPFDPGSPEIGSLYPSFLPDGETLLVALASADGVGSLAVRSEARTHVLVEHPGETLAFPAYHPSGHVFYQRGLPQSTGVWAVAVDLPTRRATGEPFLVAKDGAMPSIADDGTLLYVAISGENRQQLVWIDQTGVVGETIGQPQSAIAVPRLSPDGRRVVVAGEEEGNVDIWVHDVDRPLKTRLTRHPAYDFDPEWLPDGDRVIFSSNRNGFADIFETRADGSGEIVERVTGFADKWAGRFTPDGRRLFFHQVDEGNVDILYVDDGERQPRPYLQSASLEGMPSPSPDGGWLAYVDGETPPTTDIWIGPIETAEGRRQVSSHTGLGPVWSPRGDELFFVEGNRLMVVEVRGGVELAVALPRPLFDGTASNVLLARSNNGRARYDVARDGSRFVAIQDISRRRLKAVIVENWVP